MKVLALSGGVGGAKLALGLAQVLADDELFIVANTGDDFEYMGLSISPDLDTLTYTLAGINHPAQGWGLADDTWNTMSALEALGEDARFRIGDRDLATNLARTHRLSRGDTLSMVTQSLCQQLGVRHTVLPMSDDPVRTMLVVADGQDKHSNEKTLCFQEYFVRDQCQHVLRAIRFDNIDHARPTPAFMQLLADEQLDAIIICPSNPFLSIDPILALPGVRDALRKTAAPVIAVSPIIGGRAVKGPTAQIMNDFGIESSAKSVAQYYADILDAFVLDQQDIRMRSAIAELNLDVTCTNTLMRTLDDRIQLATDVLSFCAKLIHPEIGNTEKVINQ